MCVRSLVLCCVALGKSLPLSEPLLLSCQPPGVERLLPLFSWSLPLNPRPRALQAGEGRCDSSISASSSQPCSWHLVGSSDWQEPLPGLPKQPQILHMDTWEGSWDSCSYTTAPGFYGQRINN